MIKKSISLLLCCVLLLALLVLPQAHAQSNGFSYLQNANPNPMYTQIKLPGYDATVYAFTKTDGTNAFRVYGSLNGAEGYYPVSISRGDSYDTDGRLKVLVISTNAADDKTEDFSQPVVSKTEGPTPKNFIALGGNVFTKGTTAIVWASINNAEPHYYDAIEQIHYGAFNINSKEAYAPRLGSLQNIANDGTGLVTGDYVVYLTDGTAINANALPVEPENNADLALAATARTMASAPVASTSNVPAAGTSNVSSAPGASQNNTAASPRVSAQNTNQATNTTTTPKTQSNTTSPTYKQVGNNTNNKKTYYPEDNTRKYKIMRYQRLLAELGYFDSVIDGIYGKITANAVKQYQLKNGITGSGKLTKSTVKALNGYSHVNAKGQVVRPISNFVDESAETKKSVKDVSVGLNINKKNYAVGEYIYLTTHDLKRKSSQRLNLTLDVINVEKRTELARTTVRATSKAPATLVTAAYSEGKYQARVFVSRNKGLVLADVKEFTVGPNVNGTTPGGPNVMPGVVPGIVGPGGVIPGTQGTATPSNPGPDVMPGVVPGIVGPSGVVPGSAPNPQNTAPNNSTPSTPSASPTPSDTSDEVVPGIVPGKSAAPSAQASQNTSDDKSTAPATQSENSETTAENNVAAPEKQDGDTTNNDASEAELITEKSEKTIELVENSTVEAPEKQEKSATEAAENGPVNEETEKTEPVNEEVLVKEEASTEEDKAEKKEDHFIVEVRKPKKADVQVNKEMHFTVILKNNALQGSKYEAKMREGGKLFATKSFTYNEATKNFEATFSFTPSKAGEYTFQFAGMNSDKKEFNDGEIIYTIKE